MQATKGTKAGKARHKGRQKEQTQRQARKDTKADKARHKDRQGKEQRQDRKNTK
jgi:hypothetical protein